MLCWTLAFASLAATGCDQTTERDDSLEAELRAASDDAVDLATPTEPGALPSVDAAAEAPEDYQQDIHPTKADASCNISCETQSFSGVGLKSLTHFCGSGFYYMASGGCNISDGSAADVHLVDNYPTTASTGLGAGEWTCKAYSNKVGSFDLQACCYSCG